MGNKFWIYLLVMALTTYLIRSVPFCLFRQKIRNKKLQNFFDYIPYAVLTSMTVPAIFTSEAGIVSGIAAFAVACILAYKNKSLLIVAVFSVLVSLVAGFLPL
ncbi:MAG: AzlD domain-containing protein [Clostridia bacterium]|nr:AzlD domain-containing protein [Clostridia bacterium]